MGGYTINNLFQSIQTRGSSVNLSSGMVADNDAIAADLNTLSSIGNTLDALDSERLATTHLLPGLDQPRHLLPGMGSAMPDIINPFGTGFVGLLYGIDAVLRESLLEDRVGQAQIGTDTVVEGIVAVCYVVVSPSKLPCAVKDLSVAAWIRNHQKPHTQQSRYRL